MLQALVIITMGLRERDLFHIDLVFTVQCLWVWVIKWEAHSVDGDGLSSRI